MENNDINVNNKNIDKNELSKKIVSLDENIESLSIEIKNKQTELSTIKATRKQLIREIKSKEEKKVISEEKLRKKQINREKNEPPHLSLLEEIGNAVTHGLGSVFAITATILMLIYSNSTYEVVAAVIYGACMIILYTMSCLYHSFKSGTKVKRVFRRFDYSSIYLLIGGTFTPILLLLLNNTFGITVLTIQWVVIAVGITFVCIFGPGRLKWLHFPIYFTIGWLGGLAIIPEMLKINVSLFWWILAGGLVYTLGMIPFCFKGRKNAHFIWHFFVVVGSLLQWIGIFIHFYYL